MRFDSSNMTLRHGTGISAASGSGRLSGLARHNWLTFLTAGLAAMALAAVTGSLWIEILGMSAGALMVLLGLFARVRGAVPAAELDTRIATLFETDPTAHFQTDLDGAVIYQNAAALARFGHARGQSMAHALGGLFANPGAVLFRLQNRAHTEGTAREDVLTRRSHMRISVHSIDRKTFLWRLEDLFDRESDARSEGQAIPALTVSRHGAILFMNGALRRIVGGRVRGLDKVFEGGAAEHGTIARLIGIDGPREVLVLRHDGGAGRSEIHCLPADDALRRLADGAPAGSDIDSLPVALIRIDSEGKFAGANSRAARLMQQEFAPGTFVSEMFEGLGRSVSEWLGDAYRGRGLPGPEVLRVKHDSQEIYLQVALSSVDAGEGGGAGLMAVLTDATELKTLEAQFVQSQKMQAIGQLAGGVAHDFNNLLTAISGHCDLLLLRHDQGDPDYGDLVQIHQNANRAASLVGQLLAFSRKQNLQPEVLDMRDTLSDLTHLLNRLVGEKVTLELDHDEALAAIRADKRQLEQVLMNLVVNARDAMPDGGQIRITTRNDTLTQELERSRARVPAGDYVVVEVADNGIGIPEDKLQKIFEPFYTTKRTGEGTGLGLSTVYGIVKQTGGFIFADSVQGQGTTFSLFFPAFRRPDRASVVAETHRAPALSQTGEGVVLLVEDEGPVRAFASRALRMRGYKVIEAENAEQALETLKDPSLTVDVFVTDVVMPGVDGPTWVREALKARPETRVVFVSGYAEEGLADQQARIPNSVFLPKPFSLTELATTVMNQTAH